MITYAESAELMRDAVFQGRCEIACLRYASYISNEDPAIPAHATRMRWAQATFANATAAVAQIMPVLIMDDLVQENGSAITDPDLQSAVETSVNKFI
jgi:hypothetical protein